MTRRRPTRFKSLALTLTAAFTLSVTASAKPTNDRLSIGITQEFETLHPMISTMVASILIYYTVGHPLNSVNADWKWECWLCTEIPSLENGKARIIGRGKQRKLTADWEIKANAKWGDGTPITGHDVKFSWNVGRSPTVSTGERDIYDRIESVEVDPKNPKKFRLAFREARYDHYQMPKFFIVPKHLEEPIWNRTKDAIGAYEKQTLYATNPTHPGLYSGPYRVTEVKLGSHIIMEPNPHYYGKTPKIRKLMFRLIPNTQTLEANLLSGTIDLISELGMTMDQVLDFEDRLKKDPTLAARYDVQYRSGLTYEHIDVNLRNPILSDLRVRRALLYGMDRDKLLQALFRGKQKKALHEVHPLDEFFTDEVMQYNYEPDRAKALLDEAGWKVGSDGIRRKNGEKLSINLMTTAENKTREQVQVFLQAEWKKLGIELTLKNEPARVFFAETVQKAKFPGLAMYGTTSAPSDPPRSTCHSSQIPTPENAYSGQNRPGWKNEAVDRALDAIPSEFDAGKRNALMKIVQQEYAKELPVLPLYMRATISVAPKSLQGYRITGHQFYATLRADEWAF